MTTKINSIFLLTGMLAITINSCAQQKSIYRSCTSTMSVDDARDVIDEDNTEIADTLAKKIIIIFEQGFNDSVYVFINEKFQFRKKIKTQRFLGASTDAIDLDYSSYSQIPKISIVLEDKNNCVSFYPKENKRVIYLNQSKGAWSIETSNVLRSYR